ncbi:hypothetical protein [uncultured Thiodictyon sp.]|uniref:hypothetical protein n=1 Tax=uncultured Thiodictyon sp. TaxID=1846217 RepID=UPI0025F8B1B5|nr:hypothetical protein [uncultured Thiodictyon sp.]
MATAREMLRFLLVTVIFFGAFFLGFRWWGWVLSLAFALVMLTGPRQALCGVRQALQGARHAGERAGRWVKDHKGDYRVRIPVACCVVGGLVWVAWTATDGFLWIAQDRAGAACLAEVRNRLKDPGAARYRELRVISRNPGTGFVHVLCGEVNAKNGFGGYTGFEDFYCSEREGAQFAADSGAFGLLHFAVCRGEELSIALKTPPESGMRIRPIKAPE